MTTFLIIVGIIIFIGVIILLGNENTNDQKPVKFNATTEINYDNSTPQEKIDKVNKELNLSLTLDDIIPERFDEICTYEYTDPDRKIYRYVNGLKREKRIYNVRVMYSDSKEIIEQFECSGSDEHERFDNLKEKYNLTKISHLNLGISGLDKDGKRIRIETWRKY